MKIERAAFFLSIIMASFLYGAFAMKFHLFPSYYIERAIQQGRQVIDVFRPHHLYTAVYDYHGARTIQDDKVQDGVTLLTSYWPDMDWRAGIKLIDSLGNVLHEWNTSPGRIWPDRMPYIDKSYVHGTYLFPNGDILFNIEYEGLVRMDSCGKILWILDYKTHHSISPTDEGNFWVSGYKAIKKIDRDTDYLKHYPGLRFPIYEDHILKVTPDGKILKDINLLKVLYNNRLQRYLVKNSKKKTGDLFHLNDVEELSKKISNQYPLFQPGDVVVSLRYVNMIFVLDPNTEVVKWYTTEPFIQQHDPDFTGDGWITLFDNNKDGSFRGTMLGGSRIVAIQPHTGKSKVIYPTVLSSPFYTAQGGKWQQLSNGNILAVEASAGRVIEVAKDGSTVWEWVHERFDNDKIPEVLEATRYPYSHTQIAGWSCNHPERAKND